MFGNDWQPATGTVVDRHVTWTSSGGMFSESEFIVDVRTADGQVFRARVPQPRNATHFASPMPGDVVGVEVNAKDHSVRFDKSDPKLSSKAGRRATDTAFEELLRQAPGTKPVYTPGPNDPPAYQPPDPEVTAQRKAAWAEADAKLVAATEILRQKLEAKRRERGEA